MIVYDLEVFNTTKSIPYANCICRLSKNSGKCIRDITKQEYQKCK